jgi:thioredoxin 1
VRRIRTEEEFEKIWNEARALVCDFTAPWCGPCRQLEPVLKELEKEHKDIVFVKVDVEEMWDLSEKLGVESMPTLLFVRKGKEVKRIVGFRSRETLSREAKRLLKPAKEK